MLRCRAATAKGQRRPSCHPCATTATATETETATGRLDVATGAAARCSGGAIVDGCRLGRGGRCHLDWRTTTTMTAAAAAAAAAAVAVSGGWDAASAGGASRRSARRRPSPSSSWSSSPSSRRRVPPPSRRSLDGRCAPAAASQRNSALIYNIYSKTKRPGSMIGITLIMSVAWASGITSYSLGRS